MFRPKHLCAVCVPLLGQSIVVPHVVRRGGSEQCYREGVKIQTLEKVVDDARPLAVTVDAVKDFAGSFH